MTCRSEISTSGANRKKRAGVFFEGKMKLLAEKTMESYIMLVVVFGCSFLRMFFSVVSHDSLTLAGVASRWSSEAFEHVAIGHSSHRESPPQRLPVGPIRASFAPINSSTSDTSVFNLKFLDFICETLQIFSPKSLLFGPFTTRSDAPKVSRFSLDGKLRGTFLLHSNPGLFAKNW